MQRKLSVSVLGLFLAFLILIVFLANYHRSDVAMALPTVAAELMPGNPEPDHGCMYESYGEYDGRPPKYCQVDEHVSVSTEQGVIRTAYVFVFSSGLQIGTLVNAWGTPSRVDHGSYSTAVYWSDRWCYLVGREDFSPYSQVGFVAYGKPGGTSASKWQGFVTSDSR